MFVACVDIGGTFTYLVLHSEAGGLEIFKSPTTPGEFEQHFVERMHKNVASVGAKWTRDIERQVHEMAAGRKRDVDAVLAAADAPVRPRQ